MNNLTFMYKGHLISIICISVGQVIWGFSYLFTRVAQRTASPDIVLSMRFLLASLFLTAAILMGKASFSMRGKSWKALLLLALFDPLNAN